jgi:hypothetical protein
MSHLNLNLLENAIDSIRHAIEHYTGKEPQTRRYKYAILHLAQGVLLLLKQRLSREHPCLIYKNVSDIGGLTVDIQMLISRLSSIAGVELGDDVKTIQELVNTRNTIEHYALELKQASVDSLIGRIVPFLVGFCRDELEVDFKAEVGQETWDALQDIQSFRQYTINAARQRILVLGKPALICPNCSDYTAIEETFSVRHNWQDNVPGRTGYRIECKACLDLVEWGHKCQECGKSVPHLGPEPYLIPDYSYCEDCKAALREEFPGLSLPTYVAEVRRWFKDNDQITIRQLLEFVNNVAMHGPSGVVRYPGELLRTGVIDYASEYHRERNDRLKAAIEESQNIHYGDFFDYTSFRGDETFVWAWNLREESSS